MKNLSMKSTPDSSPCKASEPSTKDWMTSPLWEVPTGHPVHHQERKNIMIRVNKPTARKLFRQGKVIHLVPCNFPPEDPEWKGGICISQESDENFDHLVYDFIYHNCGALFGYYPHFYVEDGDYQKKMHTYIVIWKDGLNIHEKQVDAHNPIHAIGELGIEEESVLQVFTLVKDWKKVYR